MYMYLPWFSATGQALRMYWKESHNAHLFEISGVSEPARGRKGSHSKQHNQHIHVVYGTLSQIPSASLENN